jgi:hypothetical protein
MDAGSPVLGAVDVDGRAVEIDLLPANVDKLTHPQRMPEGHKDQQPVAHRIATVTSGRDQLVDLGLRQVLALPIIGVLGSASANCRLFRL